MSASETKRRLLLTKWRGELESLRDGAQSHKTEINERDEKIDNLEATVKEVEEDLEAAREAHLDEIAAMETTLTDVRYWLHDGLVMHKIVSDPRALLRKVEDVL